MRTVEYKKFQFSLICLTATKQTLLFTTGKTGGSSIMVWAAFLYIGVGPIHGLKTIMDQHVCGKIIKTVLLSYPDYMLPIILTMQQDNDPKHTSIKAKQWFLTKTKP